VPWDERGREREKEKEKGREREQKQEWERKQCSRALSYFDGIHPNMTLGHSVHSLRFESNRLLTIRATSGMK
jgi:hypothetical protein